MTGTWTANSLADETGLDRRTVKKILANTAPVDVERIEKGQRKDLEYYTLKDFVEALILYHRKGEGGGISDLEEEQARLTKHRANIAEMEESRMRGDLLPVDSVFGFLENVIVRVRQEILSVPTTRLVTEADLTKILNELYSLRDAKPEQLAGTASSVLDAVGQGA
jgi:phage terminase Nu1 subunit (DNA packaging protein)